MDIQNLKSGIAFIQNPIVLKEDYPDDAFDRRGGKLTVSLSGTDIYEGRFFPPLNVDISEIIAAFAPYYPEPETYGSSPFSQIYDWEGLIDYSVYVKAEYDGYESECVFMAVPGGISRQNFRQLVSLGTDIFNSRFLNYEGNFFLTTRTHGWRIIMKETEIYPLYFLNKLRPLDISVKECVSDRTLTFENITTGVWSLDIDGLRRQFMNDHKVIANIFDIYVSDVFSCRIVVECSDLSKERYRIKFRNSLGVFEIIELSGEISITPEYPEAENAVFKRYDSVAGNYYSDRGRVERKQSITLNTGIKRPEEVCFIMDMIGSEEVYLLDLTPLPIKVIPSVDEFIYKPRPEVPENFTIKLEIADSEVNIMQDIVNGKENSKPRVFSKLFSKQFN